MGKIFCVLGKSSSGKDTIYKRLLEEKGLSLKRIVPYTTRPIRAGEVEGVEYYFKTNEEFEALCQTGKVIESRAYQTYHGIWNYFTVEDEQINLASYHYLLIGTLESFVALKKYFGKEVVVPIYIALDDGERLDRALRRERAEKEPKYEEMCRRFLADQKDFSEEKLKEAGIEKCFFNINLETCLDEIINEIKKTINEK